MSSNRHLETLNRVMLRMTAMRNPGDMRVVLDSITTDLVEQADMAISMVWLYTTDDRCPVCCASGAELHPEERCLHACAKAGAPGGAAEPGRHKLPVGYGLPGRVVAAGKPMWVRDTDQKIPQYRADRTSVPELKGDGGETDEDLQWVMSLGIKAAAAWPLVVNGDEIVGVIGMLARRHIDEDEFAHLGVVAQQAAISIRAAQLLEENERLRTRLQVENAYLQEELRSEGGFSDIVGESPSLRKLLKSIRQVAATDSTVLLLGETGTGKELIARAIHQMSTRKDRPLIKVNCGAITPGLVDSELFGDERGAFTGALQRRTGRFELADKGTLFLDEIGELPLETQTRLLRVLQEQEFERVGGTQPIRVDIRLIAATNRDLAGEVEAGRFRADLYYRLNVFPASIPPLRERAGDVPLLVNHFVAQNRRKLGKPLEGGTVESMTRLAGYGWPGNIRELQNVIERACVLATSPIVDGAEPLAGAPGARTAGNLPTLEEAERDHIRRALKMTGGTIHGPRGAARLLGINPNTLRSRMERLGLMSGGKAVRR
jgi:transcriptional regulator with GAF, ATPase, and Fis domain